MDSICTRIGQHTGKNYHMVKYDMYLEYLQNYFYTSYCFALFLGVMHAIGLNAFHDPWCTNSQLFSHNYFFFNSEPSLGHKSMKINNPYAQRICPWIIIIFFFVVLLKNKKLPPVRRSTHYSPTTTVSWQWSRSLINIHQFFSSQRKIKWDTIPGYSNRGER